MLNMLDKFSTFFKSGKKSIAATDTTNKNTSNNNDTIIEDEETTFGLIEPARQYVA